MSDTEHCLDQCSLKPLTWTADPDRSSERSRATASVGVVLLTVCPDHSVGPIVKQDFVDPIVEFSTLVEVLRWRALQQPEQRTYTYLLDGETEGDHLTYAALDCQARSIGALLQSYRASGERALLLYPAGLEFIAAFFGCLYAGVIAVPLPPPNPAQPQRTLPRLRAIISDAQPSVVLTTSAILSKIERLFTQAPELQTMRWLATDKVTGSLAQEWRDPAVSGNTLALLQYTSGSTAEPKGVMISHGNLLHNSAYISRALRISPRTASPSPGYRPSTTWDLPTGSSNRCTRDVRVT